MHLASQLARFRDMDPGVLTSRARLADRLAWSAATAARSTARSRSSAPARRCCSCARPSTAPPASTTSPRASASPRRSPPSGCANWSTRACSSAPRTGSPGQRTRARVPAHRDGPRPRSRPPWPSCSGATATWPTSRAARSAPARGCGADVAVEVRCTEGHEVPLEEISVRVRRVPPGLTGELDCPVTSPKPIRPPPAPGRRGGDRDLVAVLEERAGRAVGERQRLGAAPGQLEQRAALVAVAAAHRARARRGRRCAGSAPLTVRCASCWAGVQYSPAARRPADRLARSAGPRG